MSARSIERGSRTGPNQTLLAVLMLAPAVLFIVALVGACSAGPSQVDPSVIEFRALVTNTSAEMAAGPLAGNEVVVNAADLLGGTISVRY